MSRRQGAPPEGQDILRHGLSPHEAWFRLNADGDIELIATDAERDPMVLLRINRTTGIISTTGTAAFVVEPPGR